MDVKHYPANGWGLQQMHGNVDEWCLDEMRDFQSRFAVDPCGAVDGLRRVVRGGGWVSFARLCRSAYRDHYGRDFASYYIGLRLALVNQSVERACAAAPTRSGARAGKVRVSEEIFTEPSALLDLVDSHLLRCHGRSP